MKPKLADEIVHGMEPAGLNDFLQGQCGITKKTVGFLQPVVNEEIDGGFLQTHRKSSAGFTAAEIGSGSNVRKGYVFTVVLVDIGKHLLNPNLRVHLDS